MATTAEALLIEAYLDIDWLCREGFGTSAKEVVSVKGRDFKIADTLKDIRSLLADDHAFQALLKVDCGYDAPPPVIEMRQPVVEMRLSGLLTGRTKEETQMAQKPDLTDRYLAECDAWADLLGVWGICLVIGGGVLLATLLLSLAHILAWWLI
jgi:hypothetical protein